MNMDSETPSVSSAQEQDQRIPVDTPIQTSAEDKLGRTALAQSFVRHLLKIKADNGFVASIYGPWGSGKTSFANIVKEKFKEKDVPVISFNPWTYDREGDLFKIFFDRLSDEIKLKITEKGEDLSDLIKIAGEFVTDGPVMESTISRIIKKNTFSSSLGVLIFLTTVIIDAYIIFHFYNFENSKEQSIFNFWFTVLLNEYQTIFDIAFLTLGLCSLNICTFYVIKHVWKTIRGIPTIHEHHEKIKIVLRERYKKHNTPIVVMIDDLDRLEDREIREIFKLVRIAAGFPYIVYIIACDKAKIVEAFEGDHYFLDKIIQMPYELPKISENALDYMIRREIGSTFPEFEHVYHDPYLYKNIIRPLFRNLRDVYRYRTAVTEAIITCGSKVRLMDIFVLEAIRLFLWKVYDNIVDGVNELTVAYDPEDYSESTGGGTLRLSEGRPESPQDRIFQALTRGLGPADYDNSIVKSMCDHLFTPHYLTETEVPKKHCYEKAASEVRQFRNHRVTHRYVLRFYLERSDTQELLDFKEAGRIFEYIRDNKEEKEGGEGLKKILCAIEPESTSEKSSSTRLANVIRCLRYYDEDFADIIRSENGGWVIKEFWGILLDWPNDSSLRIYVKRIIHILLYHMGSPEQIINIVGNIPLEQISLSDQKEIMSLSEREIEHLLLPTGSPEEIIQKKNEYCKNLKNSLLHKIEHNPEVLVDQHQLEPILRSILSWYNECRSPNIDPNPLSPLELTFERIYSNDKLLSQCGLEFIPPVEFEGDTYQLEQAVIAYRAALEEYTPEEYPLEWRAIQYGLGIILAIQGKLENSTDLLEQSEVAFREAINKQAQGEYPQEWAAIQHNLGVLYMNWGTLNHHNSRESDFRFTSAMHAFQAVFEVYSSEKHPQEWAAKKYNIGIALLIWGILTSGQNLLKHAADAFHEALEKYTEEVYPLEWFATNHKLGVVLTARGRILEDTNILEQAMTPFLKALTIYMLKEYSEQWGEIQYDMAVLLAIRGEFGSVDLFRQAEGIFNKILKVYPQEMYPEEHAKIQNNLNNVRAVQSMFASRNILFRTTVTTHRAALAERTIGGRTVEQARIQYNLGIVFVIWSEITDNVERKVDLLEQAITALREALKIYDQEEHSQEWDAAQSKLNAALETLESLRRVAGGMP